MLKSVRYLVIGLILSVAAASTAFAQNHPMPGAKSAAPVLCTGCPWSNASGQPNDGLPTYPYSGVLVNHVGRYVDSSSVQSYQMWAGGFRTARARTIRVAPTTRGNAPPRVYIQIGNAMAAYSLDTFFTTRLPGGMINVINKFSGVGPGREKMLDWDAFVYPEYSSSNWQNEGGDFQDPMSKAVPFDYDDRGYVYVATERFGWAISTDDGRTSGSHLTKVAQFVSEVRMRKDAKGNVIQPPTPEYSNTYTNTTKVTPAAVIALKKGSSYYAITADRDSQMAVWDVTNPNSATPTVVRKDDKGWGVRAMARDDGSKRIGYIDNNFQIRIFSYDGLINGDAPIAEFKPDVAGFGEVIALDEQGNFWTVEANTGKVWKLSPSGNTYTKTIYTPFSGAFKPLMMNASAGYMAIGGIDVDASTYDVRILRIESTGLTDLNVDNFFRKYYHQAPPNYAQPGSYTAIQAQSADVEVIKWGGKTYLLYSGFGLGDVFQLESGNSINISVKGAPFGTPNPNAKSTETGPFYADPVTFVAASGSPSITYDVTWNFANAESGSGNTGRSRTGEDKTHQYIGLTSANAITATKVVRAATVQDPNIQASYNLSLKVPTPRIGVSGMTAAISASTSGLQVVPGTAFSDASDGSVESHVSVWQADTTPASNALPNQTIGAGAIGEHTIKFKGSYGLYDSNLVVTSPYDTPQLTVAYTVRPFMATIDAPTSTGSSVTFSATPRYSNNTDVISATTWDVVWTVNGTPQASGVSTNALGVPLGQIPSLTLPKSSLSDGTVIGLKINVDPAKLLPAAAPYAEFTTSTTLSTPDPAILVTGCTNALAPCTFTAASANSKSMADWTYLWTLTRPAAAGGPLTATTASWVLPTTALGVQGTYTVTLKATKSIFPIEVSKTLSVQPTTCGILPQPLNVSINKVGCSTSCAPGTTVQFFPSFQGYGKQECDTFSWSFGDGSASESGEEVRHTYNSAGSYQVKLTMTNATGSLEKTTTVTVTGGTTEPPPTGNTCTVPTNITVTATCSGGSTCRTTDTVFFSARRGTASLQACDNVTWTFGDGNQSNVKAPSYQYGSAGTFTVTATVTNTNGSSQGSTSITISAPVSGNCSLAPSIGNFVIEYVGATTNCRQTNGTPCNGGETVSFSAPNYYYPVASCDNFEWDFTDGSAKVNGRDVQHAFPGGQTYVVKLRVYNNAGSYTYTRNVQVAGTAPTKPVPALTAGTFPSAGVKGRTVTFTVNSTVATTTGWTWNFGDGTPADTSQAGLSANHSTITHTFASKGTFTVSVTGRNADDAATAPTGSYQGQVAIAEAPAIPEFKFLIPVAAYTAGQGGSAWRTDVQIYNPDQQVSEAKPLVMDVTFKGHTQQLTVGKATHIYENFLGNLLGLWGMGDDSGPVVITTKSVTSPPQIWTRTYTQTANGTFGQFIPAIRIDNVGGGGAVNPGTYYMAGLRNDARYRTNIGLLNPNLAPVTATVTVYDAAKFKIGDFTTTLQPFQLDQYPLSSKVGALPNNKPFSVKIEVPAGSWMIGYASYIDGMSNDPVYVQAVPESDVASVDFKTVIVPGVGHTGQWRSDVTIFNPDPDGVMFDLQYYNSAGDKKGEALSVPLESGKFLEYSDLLKQGVLGNVDDGLGTLKVSVKDNHEKYPMVYARTYFDDGANGTYGQGIAGFSAARANVKPNKPAIIAGVRNSDAYYTNIGLVNLGTSNVTATVTLLDPTTGGAVTSVPYDIKPGETIVGAFNGWGAITQGTFRIEANGNVWAFCSIVDRKTKDPEYVPALPAE
ncbi:MAG TPA: PKD domain-containing protein [Thermoanaerobaculia bacterium]|nr:PKD domain-containing protein [Thermoanaerobaculia bacterium]